MHLSSFKKGFTLIESLVAVSVFLVITVAVYRAYETTLESVRHSRIKGTITALANEQFEILRNLSYANVGIQGGLPSGTVPQTQELIRDGIAFTVTSTIRSVDDPFDGTIGGTPKDLSPADYKLASLEITCTCEDILPMHFTTWVAPQSLETASLNGALFVKVLDSNGNPIKGADVHIENTAATAPFTIDDTTNNEGVLQIVDAPPAAAAYEISVSKEGYTASRTYTPGDPENPNPTKPHATVATQQLTQISFVIDQTSTLAISSLNYACTPIGGIHFALSGTQLIGTNPDVIEYEASHLTDSAGIRTVPQLRSDTYSLSLTDTAYDLAGTIPLLPLVLNAGITQDLKLIVTAKQPRSLLVTVRDAATQLPLSDATVSLEKSDAVTTLETGRGFIRQTEWSGGAGQNAFTDPKRFFASEHIETNDPAGDLRLRKISATEFAANGTLTSSTFDTGAASNFHHIFWEPREKPKTPGIYDTRFQIATNNDTATWNFVGPDGTSATFYTLVDQAINPAHDGDRYFRYKLFLGTSDPLTSPVVSDVAFTFTSSCVPPGQVFFNGLASGTYSMTISKNGYQTVSRSITLSQSWQQEDVTLFP